MYSPFIIWSIFVLLVFAFSLWKPNGTRIFTGFFFFVMAIGVNIITALTNQESYIEMGKNALIPFYRWVFMNIISMNTALFVLQIALMTLHKRKYVKIGLAGGIIFLVGITPPGLESTPNILFAVALAFLLRKEFDKTFLETSKTIFLNKKSRFHFKGVYPGIFKD